MDVVFRCDASVEIGTGHVARCLTLADFLKGNGVRSTFITRITDIDVARIITARGHEVSCLDSPKTKYRSTIADPNHAKYVDLSWNEDSIQVMSKAKEIDAQWLVVDHYALDSRWHEMVRPAVGRILAIDDLADRPLSCDFLLDQTYGRSAADYELWVNDNCVLLLGSEYALLRPEFLRSRGIALDRRKDIQGVSRILLSLGGSDPEQFTGRVLKSLESPDIEKNIHVDVVMGGSSRNLSAVRKLADEHCLSVSVSVDVLDMADRMVKADVAIGAAGTTTWERCSVGLPTILLTLARNQELIAENVVKAGAAFRVSAAELDDGYTVAQLIKSFDDFPDKLVSAADRCFSLVDGNGCGRVASAMGL